MSTTKATRYELRLWWRDDRGWERWVTPLAWRDDGEESQEDVVKRLVALSQPMRGKRPFWITMREIDSTNRPRAEWEVIRGAIY